MGKFINILGTTVKLTSTAVCGCFAGMLVSAFIYSWDKSKADKVNSELHHETE